MVNSHAEADEMADIATVLPSVELLRQKGITKLVLGKEIFYHYGVPDPKDPVWQGFFKASEVNKYAKQLSEAGIEVVVIGFDYRYKEKRKSIRQIKKLVNSTHAINHKILKFTTPLYVSRY